MTESSEKPFPVPDDVTQAFWDSLAQGRLRLQRCRDCGRHVHYPRAVCPYCSCTGFDWVDASGRGTVYSFTVVHRAPPGFADETPYTVALVDLEEGVRLMTRLQDVVPEDVRVGLDVELTIAGKPQPLPYFRPSGS